MEPVVREREDLQALALRAWWAWVDGDEEALMDALAEISVETGRDVADLMAEIAEAETSEEWLAGLGVGRLERLPDGSKFLLLYDGSEMLFGRRES